MFDPSFTVVGAIVGFAVGATGVGGGSLMTPALILLYGVAPTMAVGTDLLYASVTKGVAATLLGRRSALNWHIVGWLAAGSVPATLLTVWITHFMIPPAALGQLIKAVLAVAIVLTAAFMLVQEPVMRRLRRHPSGGELSPVTRRILTIVAGVTVGALVSISSVGAGVIGMVVLMLLYPREPTVHLIGSDLVHAVLVTALAGFGHVASGTVDYWMLLALLAGSLPGVWLGTHVAAHLRDRTLKRTIATILLVVGMTTLAHATTH
ncbi:MAG: sulfite exporter TauE/SafE family protein [Nevskiaceae bacterium]|nr:MAG: sulfite exporter TauE/SafE family protein [Nevskiaceae bacterium]TBR74426.1 MAG: sulfite exporter TauE/SafE family protein [Nevskiaceae bacterium]